MKKMFKLFTVMAMFSLVISLAGCNMDTEDDLLENTGKTGVGMTNGSGSKGTGSSGNSSGSGETGGGSEDPLWYSFEGADMQVWKDEWTHVATADLVPQSEWLDIIIGESGWWGMCFCNDASVGAGAAAVTFDMTKVKKIEFEAKASKKASIWVSQSNNESKPTNQTKIELGTEFAKKTFTLKNPGKNDYGVLDIGGGDLQTTTESDVVISIKNIKFLDANENECNPTRNE